MAPGSLTLQKKPSSNADVPNLARTSLDRVKEWQLIVAGMLVRLAFCLLWVTLFPSPYYGPVAGNNFFAAGSDGYIQIARTLYLSGEYTFSPGDPPVHNRPPLHPVVMLIFGAWSAEHWYIFWFVGTALLSGAFMTLILALGRMLGLTPAQNKVVLLLLAFHPYLIFASKATTFIMEAAVLMPLVIYLFLRGLRGSGWTAFLAGLACGLGALTHGSFLLLPGILGVLTLLWRKPAWSRKLASVGLLLLGTALLVLPWTARNYYQFHRFIPVVTGQGILYWLGDFDFTGRDEYRLGLFFKRTTGREPDIAFSGFKDPDDDALLWALARKDMLERPGNSLRRTALGAYGFWAPWIPSKEKGLVCGAMNLPVVLAVVVLLLRNLMQRRLQFDHIVLAFVILYINLVFAFFLAVISYFVMVLPLLLLLLVCLLAPSQRTPAPHTPTRTA
jgi:4-amino-4-deoxy-L-arabinose transferase-like glycosyltransferase